ncbi:MAG: hypothetical protein V2J07_06020 [Anaerolineae bacterium]|jgi:hypothetical protein|nr:hypothetical protein [Anaerolineae bacterium]
MIESYLISPGFAFVEEYRQSNRFSRNKHFHFLKVYKRKEISASIIFFRSINLLTTTGLETKQPVKLFLEQPEKAPNQEPCSASFLGSAMNP